MGVIIAPRNPSFCDTASVAPPIYIRDFSNDCTILAKSFISSFEISKLNPICAFFAPCQFISLSILFTSFEAAF